MNWSVRRCCGEHMVTHILGGRIFGDSGVIGIVFRGVIRGALSGSLGWGCVSGPICVVERALSVCTRRAVFFAHRVKFGRLELLSHRAFAAVIVGGRRLRGYCQDNIVRSYQRWRKPWPRMGILYLNESCRAEQRRITGLKRTSVVHFQLLCFQSFGSCQQNCPTMWGILRLCAQAMMTYHLPRSYSHGKQKP